MHYVETAGVYHPDEERTGGGVVTVEDGVIARVREEPPTDADPLFESGGYALPGLVDAHTHGPIRPWEGDQLGQMCADPAEQAVRAATNLRADLASGTTTARLLGCEHRLDLHLAALQHAGELDGPRILPCGGHLTPTNGHGHAITATDGEPAIRQRVRELVAAGAHQVKYFATGGVSSGDSGLERAPYTDAEAEAIVDEANRQGVHVAAHAHGGAGARQAIEAGVDTVEHAAAFDAGLVAELDPEQNHVVGTFSLMTDDDGIEAGDADDPDVMAALEAARDRARESWAAILDTAVPVALGTDSMHGNLPVEVQRLVEFGATPEHALRAVTTEAARAARVEDSAGTVAAGRPADLVVVSEHPLEAPETLADPELVLQNGEVVGPDPDADMAAGRP